MNNNNNINGEVYLIQQYAMKFVSDMRQISSFLWVLRFPPPIKLTAMILLKVALNTKTKPKLRFSPDIQLMLPLPDGAL